ncbi:hypothetical protein GCM10027345_19260 [Hymenobacter daeguensis]
MLGLGFYKYRQRQQHSAVHTALVYGRLAPLPATATAVRVDTEGGLFSRTFWLSFHADTAAIADWVAHSPSLAKRVLAPFSPTAYNGDGKPDWFAPQPVRGAVMFKIPFNKEALYGTVWIDYHSGTVYITTSHS